MTATNARGAARRGRRVQSGQTLVGMMIGLLLSLLTIAAMLALYKTLINVGADAGRSAERTGQLNAAMVAAELELQQAGFGIDPADPAESLAVATRQVVWRYREPGETDTRCGGLRLQEDGPGRGLYLLPATPCTAANDPGLNWSDPGQPVPRPLALEAAFFIADGEAGAFALADAQFQRTDAACFPYSQTPATGSAPVVQLVAGGSVLAGACLSNLAVAPAPSTPAGS